jgi:hypothetical protein
MWRALASWGLCSHEVELFGQHVALCDPAFQWAFPQHVHEFNPSQGLLGGVERREPQHGANDACHGAMILCHEVLGYLT